MNFGLFQFSPNKVLSQIIKYKTITSLAAFGTGTSVNRAKHTPFYFLTSGVGVSSRLVYSASFLTSLFHSLFYALYKSRSAFGF